MATDYSVPELVRTARDCFEQGQLATKDQRQRNLKALRFYNDDQWPEEIRTLRAGTPGNANNGQPAVPARPCITVNRVKEPVKQVINQMRSSDMGAEIVPADDFGDLQVVDDDEITLREGLLRRIQRAPETIDAILWMGSRAAICGEGYMGVMTRYLPGKTYDQEPYTCRFYNQSSVMIDPLHEQPDGSDSEWGLVGRDLPWPAYVAEWGMVAGKKNLLCEYTDDQFRALGDEVPGWFEFKGSSGEGDKTDARTNKTRICRVVRYYYTVRSTRALCELEDGSVAWKDELPAGVKPRQTRNVIEKKIRWADLDGIQVLDEEDWPGPDIPIIKCLGEEIHPYDTERRAVGMVSESAQQSNFSGNVMISKIVETIGLAPIAQIMMANGQDEGFESEMAGINTRTFGVLHYNQTDAEGKPAPPPMPVPITTAIGPMVQALQFFDEAVLSTVGQPSPTLGEVDPSIKTKGGLERLLEQAAHGNSNYLDNLAKSVRRMGVILNGLFYPLLGQKPGRLARIINGEGEPETVAINGEPKQQQTNGKPPKVMRLTETAKLNVNIKVTKNYETRRDQESSMLGELIAANPEFMTWFGDKFLKNTDIPDHRELSERAKVMLAPPIQAMLAEKDAGEPIPPHAQAKLAKAQEVIQQLTQANEELLKERETEGLKEQAETQRTAADNATKLQIEQIKAQAAIAKQEAADFFKQQLEEFKAAHAKMMQDDQQRHEMAIAGAEAAQAEQDAEAQRQHDANMGRQASEAGELGEQAGHRRTMEQGERGHEQNLEAQAAKPKKQTP